MSFIKDFRAFIAKGNVVDLAVAVIIGGAFGKIVTALVDDLLMPLVGKAMPGGKRLTDVFTVLTPGKDGAISYDSLELAKAAGANIFAYGDFIQVIIDFLIIALTIFVVIRSYEKMQKKKAAIPAAPPAPTASEQLLAEIRDELRKSNV